MIIFVYGTLLKGLEHSEALDDSKFLGKAMAIDVCLYDLGVFPGIKKGDGRVLGELYEVNEEALENLDEIEGYDAKNNDKSLYYRDEISIKPRKTNAKVYAYFYNLPINNTRLITGGDYQSYLRGLN